MGEIVKDPSKIARRYLAGGFFIDFISSFPFASFLEPIASQRFVSVLQNLGLLKLLRLGRIYPTVRKQNMAYENKILIKIVLMSFIIVMALHLCSAMWFFIVKENQRWVHNMDFPYVEQDQAYQPYFEVEPGTETNFWRRYAVMMYTGFYLFGVGEVVPRSTW